MRKAGDYQNSKELVVGETPSGACYASARGLAKLAAVMAHKGTLDGKTIMSESTWELMHSEPVLLEEPDFENRTFYCKSGLGMCTMKGLEGT